MGRKGYPGEFRKRVLDLVYSWRRQERIDQGLEAGLTSGERAELVAAGRRI